MADDHDDLLNFEIGDGEYGDGTLNEDELLLSDEDRDDFEDEPATAEKSPEPEEPESVPTEPEQAVEPPESLSPTEDPVDTGQTTEKLPETPPAPSEPLSKDGESVPVANQSMPSRPPFRQKFQRWPNQGPRWNNHSMGPQQQMPPYQRQTGPVMRMPMMQGGPQSRQMRPGFTPQHRPPFFNNQRMPMMPMQRQRFFYPNSGPMGVDPGMQGPPAYVPSPIMGGASGPAMPRKVLINPNFKGGVEAVKSQLMKDQFFSSTSAVPEDELLRKQQEFINHNMRQIEKRRHERSPSPKYRRYSHSPSPPSMRYRRRPPFRNNDRRRDSNGNDGKMKDENQPEEDEETRAYREQIESQRKKREEILRQKELRRKQQAEKAKEVAPPPAEPLQPIVVTDKKIVLKRAKTPERSTTPPIKEAPVTPTRRIVLKPSKPVVEAKPSLDDGSKRKIRKILNS